MNDSIMSEGVWPTWWQPARCLEWLPPFLSGLLIIASVSLVIVLLDLAMLLWQEFHPAEAQETTKAHTKAAPVSAATRESAAALKKQSHYAIKALFLLLCCCQFSRSL